MAKNGLDATNLPGKQAPDCEKGAAEIDREWYENVIIALRILKPLSPWDGTCATNVWLPKQFPELRV